MRYELYYESFVENNKSFVKYIRLIKDHKFMEYPRDSYSYVYLEEQNLPKELNYTMAIDVFKDDIIEIFKTKVLPEIRLKKLDTEYDEDYL